MSKAPRPKSRRRYTDEFKQDAVRMLLDGHSSRAVADRLGISSVSMLNRWRRKIEPPDSPVDSPRDAPVQELMETIRRLERERDILKKALSIFSRSD